MLNLVDISTLKAAIKQSESVDGTLYTKESYQSYVAAVEAGKQLLDAGTKETGCTGAETNRRKI